MFVAIREGSLYFSHVSVLFHRVSNKIRAIVCQKYVHERGAMYEKPHCLRACCVRLTCGFTSFWITLTKVRDIASHKCLCETVHMLTNALTLCWQSQARMALKYQRQDKQTVLQCLNADCPRAVDVGEELRECSCTDDLILLQRWC